MNAIQTATFGGTDLDATSWDPTPDRGMKAHHPLAAHRPASKPSEVGLRGHRDKPSSRGNKAFLTREEERDLATASLRGDRDARSKLIESNLGLVVAIALKYVGRGLDLDDLVGDGQLGLLKAAERFDPSYGTRFSTYATACIKQAIRDALTNSGSIIRIPSRMVKLLAKWRRVERTLRDRTNRTPTNDEIANALGLSPSQCVIARLALKARELRAGGVGESESETVLAEEAQFDSLPPEAAVVADEERRDLNSRLEALNDCERLILTMRHGLGGEAPRPCTEVSRQIGKSRKWVRKVEELALLKLKPADAPLPATSAWRNRAS